MILNHRGAATTYLLILMTGLLIGIFAGGAYVWFLTARPGTSFFTHNVNALPDSGTTAVQETSVPSNRPKRDEISDGRQNAIVVATNTVAPSVVGVVVTQIQIVQPRYSVDEFFDPFFLPQFVPRIRQVENMGSGFIIRSDGMILTNYHVIEGARKLYVNFADGKQLEGRIVGADPQTDIAVIAVQGKNLNAVRLGNSDKLMIGEWAIAIGNPFLNFINDAHPTVTVGVISALDRNFTPSENVYYEGMIQTDAAINPGNSGGPLVNVLGEVIGINAFIYTGSKENRTSIGIGFALPINRARLVAEELITYGKRRQVWTGIAVQDLTRQIALALGYNQASGVVIVDIQKGSPGDLAGLKTGDIIVQIGSRQIQSSRDIEGIFLDYLVGDAVKILVHRHTKDVGATLVLREYPHSR